MRGRAAARGAAATIEDDANLRIAGLLLDLAEVYKPLPRYWGYKNAARSIRRHPEFLSDLTEKEVLKIPGVGPATLRIVREVLDSGTSAIFRCIRVEATAPTASRRMSMHDIRAQHAEIERILEWARTFRPLPASNA